MSIRGFCLLGLGAGVGLLVLSWFWPSFVGGRRNWSDEQANAFDQAVADVHRLGHEMGDAQEAARLRASQGSTQAADAQVDRAVAEYNAAKKRYDEARSALDEARGRGQGAAIIMRWSGIALVAIAICGLAAQARSASEA